MTLEEHLTSLGLPSERELREIATREYSQGWEDMQIRLGNLHMVGMCFQTSTATCCRCLTEITGPHLAVFFDDNRAEDDDYPYFDLHFCPDRTACDLKASVRGESES